MQQTNKQKKAFLRQYWDFTRKERELAQEIEALRSRYIGQAIQYSDMPKTYNTEHDLSDYMSKLEPLLNKLEERRDAAIAAYHEIEDAIEQMADEHEQRLLRLRYLQGMIWDEVADAMLYSKRQTLRLHGTALEHFTIPRR